MEPEIVEIIGKPPTKAERAKFLASWRAMPKAERYRKLGLGIAHDADTVEILSSATRTRMSLPRCQIKLLIRWIEDLAIP